MATPVIMPRQGQSVETCILTSFYKSPGDEVKKGDLLFAYETDKASFEEEASEDGVFLGAFFEEGDEVPVLETVCVLGKQGEDISSLAPSIHSGERGEGDQGGDDSALEEPRKRSISEDQSSAGHVRISPRARNRASDKNVPVEQISGTGPHGRILDRDVLDWLDKQDQSQISAKSNAHVAGVTESSMPATGNLFEEFEEEALSHIRKLIARSMYQSLQESAQLTHHLSADARQLLACRKKAKETDRDITINDFLCWAVVRVLKKHPGINAHLHGETLRKFKKVHLGFAVDTERGLMVPAIQNADDLNVEGLAGRMRQLARDCRKGSVNPEILASESASFTVSNLGNYGVEMFTPVLNLPQVAILGINTITYRPEMQDDGSMAIVPVIGLSLTYNHQALDGGEATRFLKEVADELKRLRPDALIS